MNKDKIKILIWGALIFIIGFIIIDFVSDQKEEARIKEEATESAQQSKVNPNEQYGTEIGNMAYDFELEDMDGNLVRLSDFRGQKVFLNFWASWCPPCRIEAPHLKSFDENRDNDAVVLGVNVTSSESSKENAKKFIDEFGLNFTNLYETDGISYLYNAMSLPTSYFIDSNGIIQNVAIGAITEEIMENSFSSID